MTEEKVRHNEEIIELTDEIKTAPKNDDEIIELVDEVAKTDSRSAADDEAPAAEPEPDIPAAPELSLESEETSASDTTPSAFPDGEIKIGDDIDDELDLEEGEQDDFVSSMGMDLETDSAISQFTEETEPIPEPAPAETAPVPTDTVSSDQIEAAVERVLMKILPEKIDSILSAVIEKTLTREINKIKTLLLEDSSSENM